MSAQPKFKWIGAIFLFATPVIGVIGTALLCYFNMVMWQTWVLFGVYFFLTQISITAGYHRLFSHKSYEAHPIARVIIALLANANFQGSTLEWCTDHRDHHRYSDTEKDPYSITKGFWHAHMRWIFYINDSHRDYSNVEDLSASPFIRFEHKYHYYIAIFMGFVLPGLIAGLWGNMLAGVIIAGTLRIALISQSTFFINSLCHWAGKRTYSKGLTARDNWMTALVTMGEGFHNFHHQFPLDYRNGVRFFHYDPTKWLIFLMSKLGIASGLKRVSRYKILSYRLRGEEEDLKIKYANNAAFINQTVEPLKTRLTELAENAAVLDGELTKLKAKKDDSSKKHYKQYKNQLLTALKQLKPALKEWRQLKLRHV